MEARIDLDHMSGMRLWGMSLTQLRAMRDFAESQGFRVQTDPVQYLALDFHKRENPECDECFKGKPCSRFINLAEVIAFVKYHGAAIGFSTD